MNAEIQEEITGAIEKLAAQPNQFVSLARLRWQLAFIRTAELNAELTAMYKDQVINLIPHSSPRALTDDDRNAALVVGGESKTLVSLV